MEYVYQRAIEFIRENRENPDSWRFQDVELIRSIGASDVDGVYRLSIDNSGYDLVFTVMFGKVLHTSVMFDLHEDEIINRVIFDNEGNKFVMVAGVFDEEPVEVDRGDIVYMKSGSPPMTIKYFSIDSYNNLLACCMYFNEVTCCFSEIIVPIVSLTNDADNPNAFIWASGVYCPTNSDGSIDFDILKQA